ncbi:hypothetical protein GCM10027200_39970 [Lentzea nigeriaca]
MRAAYRMATAVTRQLPLGVTVVMRSACTTGFRPDAVCAADAVVPTAGEAATLAARVSAVRLEIALMGPRLVVERRRDLSV